jgi:RNA polymerase sigma-70 factor (ECF subfamily)
LPEPSISGILLKSAALMKPTREQFEQMVLEQLDVLYRVALRLTHKSDQADDLVQEACYRAIRSWESFDLQTGGIRPWLIRILRNTFLSRLERETRQPVATDDVILENALVASNSLPQGNFAAISEQMDQELVRALDRLPEEYRTVMVLWALEEFSYQEIADALEIPLGTVMSRLHRARARLAEQLEGYAKREGIQRE